MNLGRNVSKVNLKSGVSPYVAPNHLTHMNSEDGVVDNIPCKNVARSK